MVFETAFWRWFSTRRPEWKASTQAKYRSVANLSILPFWGGKEVRDVTQGQIDLFRSKLGERRLSSSSESLALILLKSFSAKATSSRKDARLSASRGRWWSTGSGPCSHMTKRES